MLFANQVGAEDNGDIGGGHLVHVGELANAYQKVHQVVEDFSVRGRQASQERGNIHGILRLSQLLGDGKGNQRLGQRPEEHLEHLGHDRDVDVGQDFLRSDQTTIELLYEPLERRFVGRDAEQSNGAEAALEQL